MVLACGNLIPPSGLLRGVQPLLIPSLNHGLLGYKEFLGQTICLDFASPFHQAAVSGARVHTSGPTVLGSGTMRLNTRKLHDQAVALHM